MRNTQPLDYLITDPVALARAGRAPTRPDHLAGAVLRSLGRSYAGCYSWGVTRTVVLGLLSFGLLPLLSWVRAFREYVVIEQQQLWHLAEWIRLQTPHPDAARLREAVERLRWRPALAACSLAWVAAVVGLFLAGLSGAWQWDRAAWDATYGFLPGGPHLYPDSGRAGFLFSAWTAGMGLAYAFQWLQVQLHAGNLRQFANQFNDALAWEGVRPVRVPRVGAGFRPLWVVGGFFAVAAGAFWAVPMLLAGAVQRRYINHSSARFRAEAAEGVRAVLMLRRPALRVPQLASPARWCRNDNCCNPLSTLANFCPRCGTRVATALNDVA